MTATVELLAERDQLRRFARALVSAVHDCELERAGVELAFYHDTDVVAGQIAGVLSTPFDPSPERLRPLVVRALLSSGFLGGVRMLRAHLIELEEFIGRLPQYRHRAEVGRFSARVRDLLEQHGVGDVMRRLAHAARADASPTDQVRQFVALLGEVGPQAFVLFELACGTWMERFRRFRSHLLNLSDPGAELDTLLSDPKVLELNEMISSVASPSRSSLANLRDAAALGALVRMVEGHAASPRTMVRFYTETDTLRRAWSRHVSLRRLLSYGQEAPSDADPEFIVRDADYFVVRAIFEELRFPGVRLAQSRTPAVSWEGLREARDRLQVLLARDHRDLPGMIDEVTIGGETLARVIERYESLSFVHSIWSTYELPPVVTEAIPAWTDVWRFARNVAGDEIRREVTEYHEAIRTQVTRAITWSEELQALRLAAESLRRRWGNSDVVPDALRDLGLVRWGADVSPLERRRLQDDISTLVQGSDVERTRVCSMLATQITDGESNPERLLGLCKTLWVLGMFSAVARVLAPVMRVGSTPFALEVLRAAAELRDRQHASLPERANRLETLLAQLHHMPDAEQSRHRLGVGYCLFYAWQAASLGGSRVPTSRAADAVGLGTLRQESRDSITSRWAAAAFEMGERAVDEFDPLSLRWAYALNHCVFVGTATRRPRRVVEKYADRLVELKRYPDLWHYRFDDTLAYFDYVGVRTEWRRAKRSQEAPSGETRTRWCRVLRRALTTLELAHPRFGDPEPGEHEAAIDRLAQQIECSS